MHPELANLGQKSSIQAYNTAFWNVYMEIYTKMSDAILCDANTVFIYVYRLKDADQMQVIMYNPTYLL